MTAKVVFKQLRPDAVVPRYMTENAAGMDLAAAIDEARVLAAGERARVRAWRRSTASPS
jgi:dUTPase